MKIINREPSQLGRRTRLALPNKPIRNMKDGIEAFEDYWTDSDRSNASHTLSHNMSEGLNGKILKQNVNAKGKNNLSRIGRRTLQDPIGNKIIRTDAHGLDMFNDYWTDSEMSPCSSTHLSSISEDLADEVSEAESVQGTEDGSDEDNRQVRKESLIEKDNVQSKTPRKSLTQDEDMTNNFKTPRTSRRRQTRGSVTPLVDKGDLDKTLTNSVPQTNLHNNSFKTPQTAERRLTRSTTTPTTAVLSPNINVGSLKKAKSIHNTPKQSLRKSVGDISIKTLRRSGLHLANDENNEALQADSCKDIAKFKKSLDGLALNRTFSYTPKRTPLKNVKDHNITADKIQSVHTKDKVKGQDAAATSETFNEDKPVDTPRPAKRLRSQEDQLCEQDVAFDQTYIADVENMAVDEASPKVSRAARLRKSLVEKNPVLGKTFMNRSCNTSLHSVLDDPDVLGRSRYKSMHTFFEDSPVYQGAYVDADSSSSKDTVNIAEKLRKKKQIRRTDRKSHARRRQTLKPIPIEDTPYKQVSKKKLPDSDGSFHQLRKRKSNGKSTIAESQNIFCKDDSNPSFQQPKKRRSTRKSATDEVPKDDQCIKESDASLNISKKRHSLNKSLIKEIDKNTTLDLNSGPSETSRRATVNQCCSPKDSARLEMKSSGDTEEIAKQLNELVQNSCNASTSPLVLSKQAEKSIALPTSNSLTSNSDLKDTSKHAESAPAEKRPRSSVNKSIQIELEDAQRMPPPKHKRAKKDKIVVPDDQPLRRSDRSRIAPLQSWRFERQKYEILESGSIRVAVEKGSDTPQRRKRNVVKPAPTDTAPETDVNDTMTTVMNPTSETDEVVSLHKMYSNVEWFEPKSKRGKVAIGKCLSSSHISMGYIKLAGKGIKETQLPTENVFFAVIKGRIQVTLRESKLTLNENSQIVVPKFNTYSLRNLEKSEALLLFSTFDMPFFKYQELQVDENE